jgi:hypothetical protein
MWTLLLAETEMLALDADQVTACLLKMDMFAVHCPLCKCKQSLIIIITDKYSNLQSACRERSVIGI